MENNQFNQNEATDGYGGAIAIIISEINVFNNNVFIDNVDTSLSAGNTNNIYNESEEFKFDGIGIDKLSSNIHQDVLPYLDGVYNQFIALSNNNDITDLYPYLVTNDICYVNIDNTQLTKNGDSWDTAYNTIQECIDKLYENVVNGGEIWVKRGLYNPTDVPEWKQKINKNGPMHKSFIMREKIRIYGGFSGSETIRSQRNFNQNPTYLSCNIGNGLYCNQLINAADNSLIDGFIFIEVQYQPLLSHDHHRRRLANSLSIQQILSSTSTNIGGGIYSNSTTINVVNSIFYALFSSEKGGAVYCIGQQGENAQNIKSPTFINVAFIKNRANERGGGISADVSCNFICNYCIFDTNSCAKKGGGIYLDFDSNPSISNSIFINNYAFESGGCIAADGKSNVTFTNAEFDNNYAKWEGGCLYSGSGVSEGIIQGFIFNDNNYSFTNNYLNNSGIFGSGQNNIYGWPFSTILFKDGGEGINEENTTITSTQQII